MWQTATQKKTQFISFDIRTIILYSHRAPSTHIMPFIKEKLVVFRVVKKNNLSLSDKINLFE